MFSCIKSCPGSSAGWHVVSWILFEKGRGCSKKVGGKCRKGCMQTAKWYYLFCDRVAN